MDIGQEEVLSALAALGIQQVECALDGGGDSGESEIASVAYADGRQEPSLPETVIGFDRGRPIMLDDAVLDLASGAPEGDWVNNAGGHGTVSLFPLEPDPDDRICCDMEFRDEDGDEDRFEDEPDDGPATYAEADTIAALPVIRGDVA